MRRPENFIFKTLAEDITLGTTGAVELNNVTSMVAGTGGDPQKLVLADSLTNPTKWEIIHYSTIDTGNSTVNITARAQEGTTAQAFDSGAYAFQTITNEFLDQVPLMSNDNDFTGLDTFSNSSITGSTTHDFLNYNDGASAEIVIGLYLGNSYITMLDTTGNYGCSLDSATGQIFARGNGAGASSGNIKLLNNNQSSRFIYLDDDNDISIGTAIGTGNKVLSDQYIRYSFSFSGLATNATATNSGTATDTGTMLTFQTDTGSSDYVNVREALSVNFDLADDYSFLWNGKINTATTQDIFIGFAGFTEAAVTPADATATTVHVGFFIEDNNLYASNADNTTQTRTLIGLCGTSPRQLRFVRTGSSILFYVDSVLEATHTTNLPGAASCYLFMGITTQTTAAKTLSTYSLDVLHREFNT